MLVFFTNLSLMEFQARYLALFGLFSIIDSFEWFWMGCLHKNILLMVKLLETSFLVLLYINDFPMMLSVILLSMLMKLSTVSVIRHLISDNKYSWFLDLNLIIEILWTGVGCGLLISMPEKLNLFCFNNTITLVLLM